LDIKSVEASEGELVFESPLLLVFLPLSFQWPVKMSSTQLGEGLDGPRQTYEDTDAMDRFEAVAKKTSDEQNQN